MTVTPVEAPPENRMGMGKGLEDDNKKDILFD
jgi:hypothetical protein